ncbi:DNA repair protein RecO [Candidatus Saccharibacteria bacterium]|nr:DNA repair protein RecO [Candidatus Saccharibacteria bacterium]MCB9834751.1 DNA repair protein RecO [Candidatus Nomurabacteria bacterium]
MPDSNIVKLTGIVLRKSSFKEADQFIDFFTEEQGKVTAIAKGVLRPQAKLRGYLEPNFILSIELTARGKIPIVTALDSNQSINLRNLEQIETLSQIVLLIGKHTIHNYPQAELWQSLSTIYRDFDLIELDLIRIFFKSQLLAQSGSLPRLDQTKLPQLLLSELVNLDSLNQIQTLNPESLTNLDHRFENWLDQLIIQLL